MDCRTQGSVNTCRYTPADRYDSYSGYDLQCAGFGRCGGDPSDYLWEIHSAEVYERDEWEYDRCQPWNPCNTKPGQVEGYVPPGLYGNKGTKKSSNVTKSATKVKTSKSSTKTAKKKKK
ncbi:hypothetical protein C1I99_17375 [Micromonospora deserti]|uniref:Uncharacterized protein n=1 Tax=Micromonospora deserti TaxID=2070366 RepID=A0A2W2DTX5_9ACTN|nr:hypothetical protein C1I99_17375 [Micromonospora deserti]